MLTALPGSSPLLTTAPASNATQSPKSSTTGGTSPGASSAANAPANSSAGPEAAARTAQMRGGFARALQQAAASESRHQDGPAEGTDPAARAPGERPGRAHGAAKANPNRAAASGRVERAPSPAGPAHTGADKGSASALDGSTAGTARASPLLKGEAAAADATLPTAGAGAVGALLTQLQATASAATQAAGHGHDPALADGNTAAPHASRGLAGRPEAVPQDSGSPGARRAAGWARDEPLHLASGAGKHEALPASTAPSPTSTALPASSPALQAFFMEPTGGAVGAAERRPALGAELLPSASQALAGAGMQHAQLLVGHAEPSAAAGEARLTASPGSPEFGPQLGAQITTFVRDGLELARLQLHPADMGPVQVQIQIDGLTAQVHLSADNAVTRQALEDALPQLASQLREAGLTLSGGGVSEQAQQGRQAPSDKPADRSSTADAPGESAATAQDLRQPVTRRGVVDLVA